MISTQCCLKKVTIPIKQCCLLGALWVSKETPKAVPRRATKPASQRKVESQDTGGPTSSIRQQGPERSLQTTIPANIHYRNIPDWNTAPAPGNMQASARLFARH